MGPPEWVLRHPREWCSLVSRHNLEHRPDHRRPRLTPTFRHSASTVSAMTLILSLSARITPFDSRGHLAPAFPTQGGSAFLPCVAPFTHPTRRQVFYSRSPLHCRSTQTI